MKKSSIASAGLLAAGCLIIVCIAALAPAKGIASPAAIGTVKEIRSGTLERQERDVWKPLAAGAVIFSNDRVRTGAGSTAVLSLNDIGSILVGPGTEYYLGDPAREFKSLLKHGYLWVSAKLKPGSRMSIATTSAVAGVRGTKFSVIQDAEGADVCTCKGEVQVTMRDGKSMSVTSGKYAMIDSKGNAKQPENGKPHLEKIWNEKPERYKPCLNCHRRGQKIGDLI